MPVPSHWSRPLLISGIVVMLLTLIDPMEGSVLAVPGALLVALGAIARHGRYRGVSITAAALVAVGVAALWIMSSFGGVGGNSGRSMWWIALTLPYPIGWMLGLFGGVRQLREPPAAAA